ncbi:peptidylprolyl isomerase [Leucobacter sp. CSA1]|uniref:Peptidylprolyl isomerase n=1 Tax=Leucobacter chromiisoli TaxID=2796471 RepID=A0A934Q7G5_9MICO|nr:peptidylprolyl isomerase [Leucobacter chromiisoli]MBK0419108.1 peptidylprolyl isomerase [Leucobacter chromiisoli]
MRRRIVPATAAIALLLGGATACSSATPAESCAPTLEPGALSDNVTVLGEVGATPEVTIPDDMVITNWQRTVVSEGEDRSAVATEGSLATINLAFFDSKSGELLDEAIGRDAERGASFVLVDRDVPNPIGEAVRCAAPGDRVVVAMSPEDSAQMGAQFGLSEGASLVSVVDVVALSEPEIDGRAKGLPSGFPAVVTDDSGQPGVVLPPRDLPAGKHSATRIAGDGPEVRADDSVIADVLVVDAETGAVATDPATGQPFNSWESGTPRPLYTEDQMGQSGVTFRDEITGKKVGSQVVVVENDEQGSRVSVVNILGIG